MNFGMVPYKNVTNTLKHDVFGFQVWIGFLVEKLGCKSLEN